MRWRLRRNATWSRFASLTGGDRHLEDQLTEPGMQIVRKFIKSDDGVVIAEYGLLLSMVAVVLVGVAFLFGGQISAWFRRQTDYITTQGT